MLSRQPGCTGRQWLMIFLASVAVFGVGLLLGTFVIYPARVDNGRSAEKYQELVRDEDRRITDLFMDAVEAKNIETSLRWLSEKVHFAGTKQGDAVAQFIHDQLTSYGLDKVEFEDYDVLLSYPNQKDPDTVWLLDDADKEEKISDGFSKILTDEERVTTNANIRFNAFSKDGDVKTERLIYANFGTRDDFKFLVDKGVNITDAIVLIRYRKLWRGAKVQVAQEYGAAGVLLYGDPAQETLNNNINDEANYPNTVYMPGSATQRGTVVFHDYGDILTPRLPATEYVTRHDVKEMYKTKMISSIPVTPISYLEAARLLNVIGGEAAPSSWQGGLNMTYRLGPEIKDNGKVRLVVNTFTTKRRIRNVIGYIKGSIEPDRYVILGNHHDAWGYGALDPSSGTATMLEVAQAFMKVVKSTGWRPRRTLMFCAWDAEEYGLIGSTEFVEQYAERLRNAAVAYLNVDIGVTGNETIWAKSVPLLKKALFAAATKVPNPDAESASKGFATVYDNWVSRKADGKEPTKPWIDYIGSGSDYRHFLDYVGIPSLDFRYTDAKDRSYPLYHTIHETMNLAKMIDNDFRFHQAVARMWGEMARYLADSLFIPFNPVDYANSLKTYAEQLSMSINNSTGIHHANISYLIAGVDAFATAAQAFEKQLESLRSSNNHDVATIRTVNDKLLRLERMFIIPFGLPERSYLRHVVFAPSADDTYSGVTFAGITDVLGWIAKRGSTPTEDEIDDLQIVLNDQISWAAHCLFSAVDLLNREAAY